MDKSILKEYNKVREIKDSSIISYDPTATICYAPRKNMYFDALGYVYSCCYNRWKPIGEYPRMTLNEIWNGELAKELRKDILIKEVLDNHVVLKNVEEFIDIIENG